MAVIDASAAQVMQLASEVLQARDTIARQQRTIWGLVMCLRAERQASTALADVLDVLLSEPGDA